MQLVYLVFSLLLRFMPSLWVFMLPNQFRQTTAPSTREDSYALWIPILGWVTVSVEHLRGDWLTWRVTSIYRLGQPHHFLEYSRPKPRCRSFSILHFAIKSQSESSSDTPGHLKKRL